MRHDPDVERLLKRHAEVPTEPLFPVPAATGSTDETKTHKRAAKKPTQRRQGVTMSSRTGAPERAPAVELDEQAEAFRARYLELVQGISRIEAATELATRQLRDEQKQILNWFADRVPTGYEGLHDGATLAAWRPGRRSFDLERAVSFLTEEQRRACLVDEPVYDRKKVERLLPGPLKDAAMMPGEPKLEVL